MNAIVSCMVMVIPVGKDKLTVEDFDQDSKYLRALEDAAYIAEIEGLAELTALASHPITKFVKDRPFEGCFRINPAISDKYQYFEDIPYIAWTPPLHDHEIPKRLGCGVIQTKGKPLVMTACSRDMSDYAKAIGNHCWTLGCVNCGNAAALRRGAESESRLLSLYDINSRKDGSAEFPRHWVLSPPQILSKEAMQLPETYDALFKYAVQMLKYHGIHSGAVVFHPWRKKKDDSSWYLAPHFHVVSYGWANSKEIWENYAIRDNNGNIITSWILEEIHHGEKIRSVRQTIAYLLTHCGLCSYPRHENRNVRKNKRMHSIPIVDILDVLIDYKGVSKISEIDASDVSEIDFVPLTIKELNTYSESFFKDVKGFNSIYWDIDIDIVDLIEAMDDLEFTDESYIRDEHLVSRVDFESIIKRRLKGYYHNVRWFGDLSTNNVRVFDVYKDKRVRECPVCGTALKIYNGVHDCNPVSAEYTHKSKIRTISDDYDAVVQLYADHKDSLDQSGLTKMDFALAVPACSTPESAGLSKHRPSMSSDEIVVRKMNLMVYFKDDSGGFTPKIMSRVQFAAMKDSGQFTEDEYFVGTGASYPSYVKTQEYSRVSVVQEDNDFEGIETL